jgi:hypothetical protein
MSWFGTAVAANEDIEALFCGDKTEAVYCQTLSDSLL